MPRLKTHLRRTKRDEEAVVMLLRSGHDFLRCGYGERPNDETECAAWLDSLRDEWAALGDEAMAREAEHNKLSWPRRPWGWWMFVACEEPPSCLDPRWHESWRLFDLCELTGEEIMRCRTMVGEELGCSRQRVGMDPPHWITELETLAARLDSSP